jgi:hypothetical protein
VSEQCSLRYPCGHGHLHDDRADPQPVTARIPFFLVFAPPLDHGRAALRVARLQLTTTRSRHAPTTPRTPRAWSELPDDVGVIDRITDLVPRHLRPLVEWSAGDGAITLALSRLGRPLHGIEIDPARARALHRRTGPHVCISEGDILRHAPPPDSTIVSDVPFNVTTPVLRHLLAAPGWQRAVLVIQWEAPANAPASASAEQRN